MMVHHHFVRRLHALGVTVDVLHGEPFRFIWQGGIEFPHFGDLFPHVPGPQMLFRTSASAQEVVAVGFEAAQQAVFVPMAGWHGFRSRFFC